MENNQKQKVKLNFQLIFINFINILSWKVWSVGYAILILLTFSDCSQLLDPFYNPKSMQINHSVEL